MHDSFFKKKSKTLFISYDSVDFFFLLFQRYIYYSNFKMHFLSSFPVVQNIFLSNTMFRTMQIAKVIRKIELVLVLFEYIENRTCCLWNLKNKEFMVKQVGNRSVASQRNINFSFCIIAEKFDHLNQWQKTF